jgi:hypothetical protein
MDQPFEIAIEAGLDESGNLINARITQKAGDANLLDLFARLVAAMNSSGALYYLQALNVNNPSARVVFTIKQDHDNILGTFESEAASSQDAHNIAKGFSALIAYGLIARKGKDEEPIFQHTSATYEDKKVVFKVSMPRHEVEELIKRGIASVPEAGSPSP